jgi:glycine/D-amino acid oxidase-like deaminating enzyme
VSRAIVILGAGLTGSGTALELARQGVPSVLIDQDERPLNRASLRNEGKIHLGFIYANDGSGATARLQLQGALAFRRLLVRWVGARADRLPKSSPFVYLVARDSVLTAGRLASHYADIEQTCRTWLDADPTADYLGARPERLFERCPPESLSPYIRSERFAACFRTAEIAVDTAHLADMLRQALAASPLVTFLPHRRVLAVDRAAGAFVVRGDGPDGAWELRADQVVNALWENRLAIDRTAGLAAQPGWLHRLKYRVIARLPERLRGGPSATMVLGRYGDVVIRSDGTAYLSWYPAGLQGWTHELAPPVDWNGPCRGEPPPGVAATVARTILEAIDDWYPGMAESEPLLVDAGAIVAWGRTDVDDAASALHDRTRVGVTSVDGYHSVDPGKLTTAPLFAEAAAGRVLGVPLPA